MLIRLATEQDSDIVVELIQELAHSGGETSPITSEFVAEYLARPDSRILLAEEDGRVVGLLSYSIRPDLYHAGLSGEIETLVVREAARGSGVGRLLVQRVIAIAEEEEWAEISVSAMPDNRRAIEFYRKNGFGDEAILLEWHLDG